MVGLPGLSGVGDVDHPPSPCGLWRAGAVTEVALAAGPFDRLRAGAA